MPRSLEWGLRLVFEEGELTVPDTNKTASEWSAWREACRAAGRDPDAYRNRLWVSGFSGGWYDAADGKPPAVTPDKCCSVKVARCSTAAGYLAGYRARQGVSIAAE